MKHGPSLQRGLEKRLASAEIVDPAAVDRLLVLLERLAAPEAPTSVHDGGEALRVHVADSLSGLEVPELREAVTVADLGAGAGLPGLVLAAVGSAQEVHLVESNGRKAAFIAETATAMGLVNVEVVTSRAEEWQAGMERCDAVCARAVAALPVLAEYAAPLLRPGGVLVAWKGEVDPVEARDGEAAAAVLGLEALSPRPVTPFPGSARRTLHVFRKTGVTPDRFPRRAGMAAKRPLAAG